MRDLGFTGFFLFVGIRAIGITIAIIGNKFLKKVRKDRKEFVTRADRRIIRYVMSKFEILLSGKRGKELQMVNDIFSVMQKYGRDIAIKQIFAVDVVFVVTGVVGSFWLWYSGNAILAGTMGFAIFSLWRMLFGRMRGQIESSIYGLTSWYDNWTHVEKLRDFLDNPKKITGYDEGKAFTYGTGNIKIQHVNFGYDAIEANQHDQNDTSVVFNNLSLSITGGTKTALVGVSGSGKSTLVKLIAGYLRPDSGSIIVDGQDLRDVSLKSYYKHIGYLTQEPSVFDGTIIDNLTYAIDGDVDQEKLKNIISLAKCDFIREFPNGLETEIGERGIRLSGGQRQRLAIAKVFLKDPEIIILDEPTSALDSFSEEAITEAMHNLFKNRTVIIVAHRLQTVKNADEIIVLDEGKVLERGTHDELVTLGGSYAKMLELQSGF